MSKTLIIVESIKKAKTIKSILGRGYEIQATGGHVLEMPGDELHVDLETFQPTLHVIRGKGKRLQALSKAAADADRVLLATDPDREGEAIARHVSDRLGRQVAGRAQRIAFTAITERDIRAALASPRPIDHNLVEAQTARRVIDRLVGYMVSPVLWAGLSGRKRLSAGRVQSPALWLVVQREREIRQFVAEEWWSVDAELSKQAGPAETFWARLVSINGQKPSLKNAEAAHKVKDALENAAWRVAQVKKGQQTRRPYPPFTTDSLQQAASSQLGMSPKMTMSLAQQLYEGVDVGEGKPAGLITYLRTDSVAVAPEAQQAARDIVTRFWGAAYLPASPPHYATRDKTAQEAHEAIRPTDPLRAPKQLEPHLSPPQYRLYRLIWRRFIASQMKPALYDTVTIDIETFLNQNGRLASDPGPYLFQARGRSLRFAGFLKVYGVDEDAEAARTNTSQTEDDSPPENSALPKLQKGDDLTLHQLLPKQHFTQPPPRFSEAALIGQLKKRGLGRPSTYATIIETLKQRQYVQVEQKRLHPTELGFQVCELLEKTIEMAVDVEFTARMEADLDAIARGETARLQAMQAFYGPFKETVDKALDEARRIRQPAARLPSDGSKKQPGRKRKRRTTKARSTSRRAGSKKALPQSDRAGQTCPTCGQGELVVRSGKYGPFLGCSRFSQGCRHTEPLPSGQSQ
jgi:DNA topoisomerase-1